MGEIVMIYHITEKLAWETAVSQNQAYTAPSLQTEGFIHCSTAAQILGPANALFHGQQGLILLCIQPAAVTAVIKYEDCYDHGDQFPHIYGTLNLEAVVSVVPFPPNADGSFSLPPTLP